jgi:hypothetical protein
VKPATAEVDGHAIVLNGPGAAANALARLDQQDIDTGVVQAACRGKAGGSGADDNDACIRIWRVRHE